MAKVVEIAPPATVQFVVEELTGRAIQTAQHRYGCRILCRLLEHCRHEQTKDLIDELLQEAFALCRGHYSNYVMQHVLEHGMLAHRQLIVETLLADVTKFAKNRMASSVVEKALLYCTGEERKCFISRLLLDTSSFAEVSCSRYGRYVVRVLLQLPGVDVAEVREQVSVLEPLLQASEDGRRLLMKVKGTERTA